jgi:hypothetical protein
MNTYRYRYKANGTYEQICINKLIEKFNSITSPMQLLSASESDIKSLSPGDFVKLITSIPQTSLSIIPSTQLKKLYSMLTPQQIAAIPPSLLNEFKKILEPTTAPTTEPTTSSSSTASSASTASSTTSSASSSTSSTTTTTSDLPICQSFYLCSDYYNKDSDANKNCPNMRKSCSYNT